MGKFEKILTQIVKVILNIIFAILSIIAVILIYNIIQLSIFNKPYMNLFGYSVFEIKTGSMSGTLEVDDIIVVKLTKEVNKNDIITFSIDNTVITHRVLELENETITTKGDANNTKDEPITKSQVIGKVVFSFKNMAIWKQVFTTPQVYILIIITLVLFGISISIKEENKEQRSYLDEQ